MAREMAEDANSAPQQVQPVTSGLGGAIEFGRAVRSDLPSQVEVSPYRVLARKYRPQTFAELIGQEAVVRTLSNAIAQGRIAHAFMLTGVRGVGKTTTARIIARALNCVGRDGRGLPTVAPCGECRHCRAIAEDRDIDVIEMDAASRTGVDDIRELTEGVRYRPVSARYKVYIIDEVHMLSKNAFNALLKTLEEPPPAVIFVFATTEIQKVPVTVLSRCQRFSLRRVPVDLLIAHYRSIAEAERIEADDEALALIARAADGSVRDGLSLLDQATSLGDGRVEAAAVRDMLGVADRDAVFDLLESVLSGDAAGAFLRMDRLYQGGADPLLVLQDLLELGHFLTRLKLAPEAGIGDPIAESDRRRGRPLADRLSMPVLARLWQMLLKGLGELQSAPNPTQAMEMILIRLAYTADLPAPAELIRAFEPAPAPVSVPGRPSAQGGGSGDRATRGQAPAGGGAAAAADRQPAPIAGAASVPATQHADDGAQPRLGKDRADARGAAGNGSLAEPASMPQSFAEVVVLFDERREALLSAQLREYAHLVSFEPGRIEFRPAAGAPADLANRLGRLLGEWTGTRWLVAVSEMAGEPTLRQQQERSDREQREALGSHPLVRAVFETFPGAAIAAVRERFAAGPPQDNTEGDEAGSEEDET
jgi:DNA polymerase III subunit gamma/tau